MSASSRTTRNRWSLCVSIVLLAALPAPSAVEGSPIVYSRPAFCVLFDCGPGNAIPDDISPTENNWYIPHEVLTPFVFNEETVIDEIDYWSQFPFGTFTVQKVADVGNPPCCQTAPPVATLTFGPGSHAEPFGVDPNCRPPSSCSFYSITMPLATPFVAQAGVPYYLSADADLVVGFRQVGLDAGSAWKIARCPDNHQPCPTAGAAFTLRGNVVPEPATLLLVSAGLMAIGRRVRRLPRSASLGRAVSSPQ